MATECKYEKFINDADRVLFKGNGVPPVTVTLATHSEKLETIEKKLDTNSKWTRAIVVVLLGQVLATVGAVTVMSFKDNSHPHDVALTERR